MPRNYFFSHRIKLDYFDCEVRKATKPKIEKVFVYYS
ncbi:hypothetical protein SAMN05216297_1079 [Flavobacterium phragmitis]|uniref:Uncharacterized protein n=1 Tax=Flavobacterium phragmitis TaxID=739143 RepID=A0A1I1RIL4_9FLAO|nr:hypothetical protein SAMN05216297_1079 [Flavobacterium phragmitis]